MNSKLLAEKIEKVLDDRKGKNIEIIDTSKQTIIADYFIICSGTSTTHLRGLADEVEKRLSEDGKQCTHKEGYDTAKWILLDYLDVVVHLFLEEEREFYNLERLWRDGGRHTMHILKKEDIEK